MSIKQAWINLARVIIRRSLVSETLNLFGATDEPNNCCPTAETWRSRVDSDQTFNFFPFLSEGTRSPPWFSEPPSLPALHANLSFFLSISALFFPTVTDGASCAV